MYNIFKIPIQHFQGRILWIDYAKFFAIWGVILGHTYLDKETCTFIYIFHMPLFFFVSGLFEKGDNIKTSLIKIFRTLYVPYIVFSLFSFSYCWCYPIMHPELYPEIKSLLQIFSAATIGILIMDDTVKTFAYLPNSPLWFLAALIVIKIIFSLIHHLLNKYRIGSTVISVN